SHERGLGGSGSHATLVSSGSGSGSGSGSRSRANIPTEETTQVALVGEERATPGALVTVRLPAREANLDGYTLYLPRQYADTSRRFPMIVYLQGVFGVGGPISNVNHWGLPRLLRDTGDVEAAPYRRLLEDFVVVSLHIVEGRYDQGPEAVAKILDDFTKRYRIDANRISVTGLSRGGHGSWGLAAKLAGRFAAISPIGGDADEVEDMHALANTAIWVAHNADDGAVPFESALAAVQRVEEAFDVDFLRVDPSGIASTDYRDRRYVLTSSPTGGHDAWTDHYRSSAFYEWLLVQERRSDR
ncbi:MAG TPA: hypothetical protein PKE00_13130, partial [Planctomycetota bacterium]|nr:hypothetical protein [Planctomycetota bacterium]